MTKIPAWSYSSLSTYTQCPRKYKYIYIDKNKEPESEAILYGNALHKAAELHIKDGAPLPPQFTFMQKYMDKVKALPGNKLTEHKLGLRKEGGKLVPCGFFDQEVWFRGVADLIVLDNIKNRAVLCDWKSGRSSQYADPLQLDLMASLVFHHFSHIEQVKGALVFVVAKDLIKQDYERKDRLFVFAKLDSILHQREVSHETGVFNAKTNFSCKRFCPDLKCPHNGRRG